MPYRGELLDGVDIEQQFLNVFARFDDLSGHMFKTELAEIQLLNGSGTAGEQRGGKAKEFHGRKIGILKGSKVPEKIGRI